jgi:hypothetical protein
MTTPDGPATITVFVTNATSTSAGNGPGYADLPSDEALWLLGEGLAVRGIHPPPNMLAGPRPVNPP